MRRYIQGAAGLVFGLSAATLVLFASVKETKPSGHAALPILWGALGASALIWVVAEFFKLRAERTGNETMNHVIRREWRRVKRGRRLRRLLPYKKTADAPTAQAAPSAAPKPPPLKPVERDQIARETEGRLVREATDGMLRGLDAQNQAARQRETDLHIELGKKLLQEINSAQSHYQWQPTFTAAQTVADLTAHVESWAGEVGGYVVPEPAKDWRLTLSRLKLYVEKQNAALRARREPR